MNSGQLANGLLSDVIGAFDRIQSVIILTDLEKNEIVDAVSKAIIETEIVFGEAKSRKISRNPDVARLWHTAGTVIIKYLPNEHLGVWLQNKGEAWANPERWSEELLDSNGMKLEEIKKRLNVLTRNRSKLFRKMK
jgi:hypothetical protein